MFIVGGCRENEIYSGGGGADIKGHLETVSYEIESRDRAVGMMKTNIDEP